MSAEATLSCWSRGRAVARGGRPAARFPRSLHQYVVKPWVLQPGTNAGVHAGWMLFNDQGRVHASKGDPVCSTPWFRQRDPST